MLTVMFDMDGTLLPMDYDAFEKGYFSLLVRHLVPHGMTKEEVITGVWAGTKAMVANDGRRTNEEVYWEKFNSMYFDRFGDLSRVFEEFYEADFDKAASFCDSNPLIPELIADLKAAGCRLVIATNPIFPKIANYKRIRWAGLEPEDFAYVSYLENSHYAKPNPEYYRELLEKLDLNPAETVMIGNDMTEDLAATEAGIRTFIVTDCVLNKHNVPMEKAPHGDWNAARAWVWDIMKHMN